jgi:hypothetical protein
MPGDEEDKRKVKVVSHDLDVIPREETPKIKKVSVLSLRSPVKSRFFPSSFLFFSNNLDIGETLISCTTRIFSCI